MNVTLVAQTANLVGLAVVISYSLGLGSRIRAASDAHPTLATPPARAFLIWALLYALLVATSIAQFFDNRLVARLSGWYSLANAATIAWLYFYTRKRASEALVAMVFATAFVGLCYLRVQRWSIIRTQQWPTIVASVTFSLYSGWMLTALLVNFLQVACARGWAEREEDVRAANKREYLTAATTLVAYAALAALGITLKDPCLLLGLAWAAAWKAIADRSIPATLVCGVSLATCLAISARL